MATSNLVHVSTPKLPPGPPGNFLLGTLLDAWADPLTMMTKGVREYGEIVGFRFAYIRYVVVADPEGIKHVLVGNHRNYTKSVNYAGLKVILGNGLLTAEGDAWKKQRRMTQPAFHRERLAGFAETMAECTRDMLDRWDGRESSAPVDAHEEMMRLTFRIVGRTLLSAEVDGDAKAIGEAMTVGIKWANDYVESVVRLPPWIPTPANVRFNRALRAIDGLMDRIITERKKSTERHDDLLGMFMEMKDEETGEGMSDKQLRDELLTLVLAGHETTANALSFALYVLSQHPNVLKDLRSEVDGVLGSRAPTLADLPKLPYTMQVIEEVMRLYPPAWCMERQAIEEDVINGHRIPKGAIIGIAPWVTHRLPRLWTNPEGFDPSRFSKEAKDARHKHAYLPFGGGPRTCIGNAFALMEMQIVLAMLVQRYRVDLVPGFQMELEPTITLRPKKGIPMHLVRI
jgi:cytochrome P450